jgi:hypothetical protein
MKEFGGFDGVKGGSERQSLMDPEPLAGVAMPLDIEPVAADPVDTGEGSIEFFTRVFGEARSVTLQEAVFASVPFALKIDRKIELCRGDNRQKPRFEDGVNELLACDRDGSLLGGG